jgi:putative hydrolase of the HAD superfamily
MVRHLSFDLWMTLIRSHPSFKSVRADLFRTFFQLETHAPSKVEAVFREIDVLVNNMNELTGRNVHTFEMYLLCLHQLGGDVKSVTTAQLQEFYEASEALLFRYTPQPLYDNTKDLLSAFREQHITLSLMSNTAFIQGRTLRKLLADWGWDQYFSFQLYSDETGHSKPSPLMFQRLLAGVQALYPHDLQSKEICHVGDNMLADVQGAQQAGMLAALVEPGVTPLNQFLYANAALL